MRFNGLISLVMAFIMAVSPAGGYYSVRGSDRFGFAAAVREEGAGNGTFENTEVLLAAASEDASSGSDKTEGNGSDASAGESGDEAGSEPNGTVSESPEEQTQSAQTESSGTGEEISSSEETTANPVSSDGTENSSMAESDPAGSTSDPSAETEPSITEAPAPTQAPSVTATPTPGEAPSVTAAPTPGEAPSVTATPTPGEAPSVTATPTPTETPSVTVTPTPSGAAITPTPSVTPSAQLIWKQQTLQAVVKDLPSWKSPSYEGLRTELSELWYFMNARMAHIPYETDVNYGIAADALTVTVQGMLPEGCSAELTLVPYDGEEYYSEKALIGFELKLLDPSGSLFIPTGDLLVTLGGSLVAGSRQAGQPLLLYLYKENPGKIRRTRLYCGDILVYADPAARADQLRFVYGKNEERMTFTAAPVQKGIGTPQPYEAQIVLSPDAFTAAEDPAVRTAANTKTAKPARMLVAAQETEKAVGAVTADGQTAVQLTGALSALHTVQAVKAGTEPFADRVPGTGLVAVDITLGTADGAPVQPDRPVTVSVTDRAVGEAAGRGETLEVWHIAASGNAERIEDAAVSGDTVTFTAESFSVYEVVSTDSVSENLLSSNAEEAPEGYEALAKELTDLEGSWAEWTITVNPDGYRIGGGDPLTLSDTFTSNQSIDYSSIRVTDGVTYDYRGQIGTYVIPDETAVQIRYRTRITASPGENVSFGNTAVLTAADDTETGKVTCSEEHIIYPSASDVATTTGTYMLRLFLYGDANMQSGLPGAEFALLNANQRPLTYTKGTYSGEAVIFMTDDTGYADIRLDEEEDGLAIQKNTVYYLEMTKAPEGYKKDNTLYSFMITDDPGYESGGVYTYYNGDTIKVRVYPEEASLTVSMRFSGNYALRQDQKDAVTVLLQKKTGEEWETVESHALTDFSYGSLTFTAGTEDSPLENGAVYRVIEENERPWDLDTGVNLTTTYALAIGSAEEETASDPMEFTVTEENRGSSFSVIITNEYEEHELTITKMNNETGEKLSGAVFSVKKASDDTLVSTLTTDSDGVITIRGGAEFESETLYYVTETEAPADYLLPVEPENIYFYFCNDTQLIPTILAELPEGEEAVNLSETYDSFQIDNQKEKISIPVMKTWQNNAWPSEVDRVVIGLYRSVAGSEPEAVIKEGEPLTVTLRSSAPYNNTAFVNLPSRDDENRTITYSIKEEHVYTSSGEDLTDEYVKEYGVSDAGVYIVRNKPATTVTVKKEWYDLTGQKLSEEDAAAQPEITFDLYRTVDRIADDVREDGITNEEMETLAGTFVKVRSSLTLDSGKRWETEIGDLAKWSDLGKQYYYYVLETVPSFGEEVYEADEDGGTVTIKNKVLPETVQVTVKKEALVNDPRPESADLPFTFTLTLSKGNHPIRSYTVYKDTGTELTTDWNGKATFTLKPEESIVLTLPVGTTAAVTEEEDPEFVAVASSGTLTDSDSADEIFGFAVEESTDEAVISYTNTLRVICKVTDKDGTEHPFESFKSALAHVRANPDLYPGNTVVIEMLEDYVMPETDVFDVREGENITLTTATTDTGVPFHFSTARTDDSDTAVIRRGGGSGSMLSNAGELILMNVTLDGARTGIPANGGIVNSTGTLRITGDAALRNASVTGKGGAVYSSGAVYMSGGSISGNTGTNGSAVYLDGGSLIMNGGSIENNTGAEDGAVAVSSTSCRISLSGSPVIYGNTNADGENANLALFVDSDNVINVVAPGLASDAKIGVRAMETHREIGEQFATAEFEVTDNLGCFINDAYEYRGKLKDGTSTNVVWDGLSLTLKKIFYGTGANPNDTFTVTLTSASIRRNTYTIDGNLDYTVTAATRTVPGSIVLRNVKAEDVITISPLPVGTYKVEEASSNYQPEYTGRNDETSAVLTVEDGSFTLAGNSTVTLANTRKTAQVTLTKELTDPLSSGAKGFPFTLTLKDPDGTLLAGCALANGCETGADGKAQITLEPSNGAPAEAIFAVPVGTALTIEEQEDPDYTVTSSAVTKSAAGEETEIPDEDPGDNAFSCTVTDEDASVTFKNERKLALIDVTKVLEGKVSSEESFAITLTLTGRDGNPAAGYTLYEDTDDTGNDITTDEDGKTVLSFLFGENETSKAVSLTIPEGMKLEAEETPVKKTVDGSEQEIYDTTVSQNGGAAAAGTLISIVQVKETDRSIVFTNSRKMQTVTVTNTVSGYSGNTSPFVYTARVTDGGTDDYDENGFTDGVQTFELATGQSKVLTVPYGAELTVEESFVVGYETQVKRGNSAAVTATKDTFTVTADETLAFTNTQLISLVLVNNTSSALENVKVYIETGTKMYRVNEAQDGQEAVPLVNHWATISVAAGKTALLSIEHGPIPSGTKKEEFSQAYTVAGTGPAEGYYYTITNEPSFHEFADPAILRIYDTETFAVKGRLRYSISDSTVTFTEQPLVTFDANGGVWTTEMDGYRDRDGDRLVWQYAVNAGETVSEPVPPVYPTEEGIEFLGWTADAAFATQAHTAGEDISENAYNFAAGVTGPLTLYAVWSREQRDDRVVTVKNETPEDLTVEVTLSGSAETADLSLTDSIITDGNGRASFALAAGSLVNLKIPDGAKLVLTASGADCIAYSSDYTDTDSAVPGFTIDSVKRDGTVLLMSGICKITDADGNILYTGSGQPAVYTTLAAAFTDYNGTLYTSSAHTSAATQAAVKMLVDEYAVAAKTPFPTKDVILTTAGRGDAEFPYAGTRDRAMLYRKAGYINDTLFTHEASATSVTLTDIILDGGSVKLNKGANGGLIYMQYTNAELNIEEGAVLRRVQYNDYSDGNNSRGGAIFIQGGTLNIRAGLFSDLRARRGGAVCAMSNAVLNITGRNGSTRFENCFAQTEDGGAIYYSAANDLVIDGGEECGIASEGEGGKTVLANPGILFTSCQALGTNSDGGAICADGSNYTRDVVVKGCAFTECSARNDRDSETAGYGGGGIDGFKVRSLTVSYCTFTSCDSMRGGGGIAAIVKTKTSETETVNKGLSIANCSFVRCNCKGQGGAVGVYQDQTGASGSMTLLAIKDSVFDQCSSGTRNGSGGAIQSYVPCMEFDNSDFTDCWAGKEGGAFNNWFGSDTAVWPSSSMTVSECSFIRCRAEDRYDISGGVHYGGAIATKAETLLIEDSRFEDCVSTLREGGAVHCTGHGENSTATVTNTIFKNCQAKTNGGALTASNKTMTLENSKFYGCNTYTGNGGAVYHGNVYKNNLSQGSTTMINSCTFSSDPEDADSESCSAAGNGGAVWSRAASVTLSGCAIDGCTAGGNGGGVYLNKNGSSNAVISGNYTDGTADGFIRKCEAVNGSAVYTEDKATFSGARITGNICSNIDSGALQGSSLYFEGDVRVEDNRCSADETYMHDALMQNANVTTIRTTSAGLGDQANIGVYVPDNRFNSYGKEGQAFGTWAKDNDFLECFFNDRDDGLFGYQNSSSDTKIYWGRWLCKITDAEGNTLKRTNGRDAVYAKLTTAFDDFTKVLDDTGETGKAVFVKMLVENYDIQQTGQITNFPSADLTLTTAGKEEPDGKHPYRGAEGTVCTISRTNSNNQLFRFDNADASFRLENITLDGRRDKSAAVGTFRMIESVNGALVIGTGTTMQYGYANNGGAVYAVNNNTPVVIEGAFAADRPEAAVRFTNCACTGAGGAIYTKYLTITNSSDTKGEYGTIFTNCTANGSGGAAYASGTAVSMSGAAFRGCHAGNEGGALFQNNNAADGSAEIRNCSFSDCYTVTNTTFASGGAVCCKAGTLMVDGSAFSGCYCLLNGGAVNHGGGQSNRVKTSITDTVFEDCRTTGTNTAYGYGGSVYSQAKAVEVNGCTFTDSTAWGHGGALYLQSNDGSSAAAVTNTTFENCSVSRDDGRGGAIAARNKSVTLDGSTSITSCTAKGFSGAVHMDTDDNGGNKNLVLTIKGNTVISGCFADQGAAVYLKNTVTMNVSGSPAFSRNGYTTDGQSASEGACIYLAEGSRINLSGSPKFSRNNLTGEARVTNGGVTDYVRQDLYLAGYQSKEAASIHVDGELTGDTIWVWPEKSPHRLPGEQFATTENTAGSSSLEKFRNALSDTVTGCSNGEYLAGVRVPGFPETNVYWDKMYEISFRKIDNKGVAVPEAGFTLYTDAACQTVYTQAVSADGETDTNMQGELLAKGTVYFPAVPIGIYYMKETAVPESFLANDTVYLVLVGTPMLSPNEYNTDLWGEGGLLDVTNAVNLVARYTTDSGKYFGIFPIKDGKADVSKNLAGANVGVTNIRNDYESWFLKTDGAGLALPNAEFTIYAQDTDSGGNGRTYANGYPVLSLWSRDGENYPDPVLSADGTTAYRKLDGTTVEKGMVYIRELPIGTYYLIETAYPERNGNNRKTFYVEKDRVFRLEIRGENDFTLSEWMEDGTYEAVETIDGSFAVRNTEAVCKLTDANDNLLYEVGRDGQTLLPAVYATLKEGFDAAQIHQLFTEDKILTEGALKLQVLKDFTMDEPVIYSSARPLTFTTASRTATAKDRYVFSTNRTTDTGRAQIRRNYSGDALLTVSDDAELTLQNIRLNGQKASYTGRGVFVEGGTLNVLDSTQIQDFRQEAAEGSAQAADSKGGAILAADGAAIWVDGGSASRSAVFTGNEALDARTEGASGADGGAVAIGTDCTVTLNNVQFTGNTAGAGDGSEGRGGAVGIFGTSTVSMKNAVFRTNSADTAGGAVYAAAGAELTTQNGTMTSNNAEEGAALYAADGAKITVSGGRITGNTAGGQNGGAVGAGGERARLYLAGNITIYDNLTENAQRNVVLSFDTNEIIRTAEAGLGASAKIGVYVAGSADADLFKEHGLAGKPFGTFANANHLDRFLNDRNTALYGIRNGEDEEDTLIYWINNGVSVAFRKIDSFGNALDGASFTLYTDADCTQVYESASGEEAAAVSADGETVTNQAGEILAKGTVLFEEIPDGIYYMKETAAPEKFRENTETYVVLAGAGSLVRPDQTAGTVWAAGSVLADITQEMIDAQTEQYTEDQEEYLLADDAQYAVFRIDAETGRASALPDLAKYGVLDLPKAERKVILKKINDTFAPLEGAVFEILRYDETPVESTDAAGNTTEEFTSGKDGIYFMDRLPFGTYYLHETTVPAGFAGSGSDDGRWFTLTVNADGTAVSAGRDAREES